MSLTGFDDNEIQAFFDRTPFSGAEMVEPKLSEKVMIIVNCDRSYYLSIKDILNKWGKDGAEINIS